MIEERSFVLEIAQSFVLELKKKKKVLSLADLRMGSLPGAWIRIASFCVFTHVSPSEL